ncbi:hypothetical protein TNCT_637371 [Trichonephila clavata]|uniref:Uncharacterized protein n=1 Tax=Trichonephila clavata TaxID=2740835 RepID=A0A8X6LCA3_TRICU|nr:hypothetical protein TNCT_637371 [Trichonephila clavata]
MRDDLAFAHCLVKYSSPDFGEFAAFLKELRNRLNALPIPEVLTVQDFQRHFHEPRCLVQRSLSFGGIWKFALSPLSLCRRTFQIQGLVLHKMAERGHGAYIRGIWTECMRNLICTERRAWPGLMGARRIWNNG